MKDPAFQSDNLDGKAKLCAWDQAASACK